MIAWIKGLIVIVGLLCTTVIHYLWPNKPQEEVMDNVVQEVVQDTTGFNIDPIEEGIDDIEDSLKK